MNYNNQVAGGIRCEGTWDGSPCHNDRGEAMQWYVNEFNHVIGMRIMCIKCEHIWDEMFTPESNQ